MKVTKVSYNPLDINHHPLIVVQFTGGFFRIDKDGDVVLSLNRSAEIKSCNLNNRTYKAAVEKGEFWVRLNIKSKELPR